MKINLKNGLHLLSVVVLLILPVVVGLFTPYTFWFLIGNSVLVAIFIYLSKGEFAWVNNFKKQFTLKTVVYGVLLGIFLWFIFDVFFKVLVESLFAIETDYSRFENLRDNLKLTLRFLFSIWVSAALCEEIIFRGFLLEKFKWISKNNWFAIVVSALLFGSIHIYQGPSGIIITTLSGIILGAIYVKSDFNLLLLFIIHGVADSIFFINIYTGWDKYIF
jgi:membrane protease YdiL (CAAX protease family)